MADSWNKPDDGYDDDDDFDSDPQEGGKGKKNPLREHLRKLEKENKDLKEANQKFNQQLRQNSIETVLTSKGLNPKVAKLVPEAVEPTAEAVGKWLEDYSDVFTPSSEDGEGSSGEGGQESSEASAQGEAMGRISEATSAAQTPSGKKQDEQARRLASDDLTKEELLKMIEQEGGGFGSG